MTCLAATRSAATALLLLALGTGLAADPIRPPSLDPQEVEIVWSGPRLSERRIALSFDDGPVPGSTDRVLDVLSAYRTYATFFCLGSRVSARGGRSLLARITAEGHEIGSHGWTHRPLTSLTNEELRREVEETADSIESITGTRPLLFRPPGGDLSVGTLRRLAGTSARRVVLWDVDPSDWRLPARARLWEKVLADIRPGSILLLHDVHRQTAEALPILLELLAEEGYKVGTVGSLLEAAPQGL